MSLDTRWLILVKDITNRNPDKWVTLSELDNYVNQEENAQISAAESAIAALETLKCEFAESVATATAATGKLSLSGNPSESDQVSIGGVTYTFVAILSAAYEVLIGASPSDTLDNLIAAITAGDGAGTTYSTGTVVHPDVTALAGDGDTMDVTAKVKGAAGNAIVTTDPADVGSVMSWGAATTLEGGIDGTIAAQGKVYVTPSALYVAIDDCTAVDSNWKTITYDT